MPRSSLASPRLLLGALVALGALSAGEARANGRMPGANDVIFDAQKPDHLLLRASFGLLQTHDRGATWQWICEQAIDISGVISDPPVGMTADESVVLLPPTGSALISRDQGCSWQREADSLRMQNGVDLTPYPGEPGQIVALFSTVSSVDAGNAVFSNAIMRTRDDARSWQLVANLPSDFAAETIELAKSDPKRIYVSGTESRDPRTGVIFVSSDGGEHFDKRTFALPAGTGSLLISAIHPTNPDMLWLRVPARGDTIGILPARLYLSSDAGQNVRQLASTQRGMFGLALSPDGSTLAYGGPNDGLYVGPADGSDKFEKRGTLGVRCLRWSDDGALYACGSEPSDPFSLGVSDDQGVSFRTLYKLADTCPSACSEGTQFAAACQSAWPAVQAQLRIANLMCSAPWLATVDAGVDAGVELDGGEQGLDARARDQVDANAEDEPDEPGDHDDDVDAPAQQRAGGCGCTVAAMNTAPGDVAWALLAAAVLFARRRRRSQPTTDL